MELHVRNAARAPLDEPCVVKVLDPRSNRCVRSARTNTGRVRVTGLDPGTYLVQAFPLTHRPVAQLVQATTDTKVDLCTPLDPDRVTSVGFPIWSQLPAPLADVLLASDVEGVSGRGADLYTGLPELSRAGLLNLYTKMAGECLTEAASAWSFVTALYRVRPDRIFADVQPGLRDLVKSSPRFRSVSGVLHTPPPGFTYAGSFKSTDPYGNLQLTFFCSPTLAFKVDADIDDAAGLSHVFQVMRHAFTNGLTHPYDIHQILTYRQDLVLPYTLE